MCFNQLAMLQYQWSRNQGGRGALGPPPMIQQGIIRLHVLYRVYSDFVDFITHCYYNVVLVHPSQYTLAPLVPTPLSISLSFQIINWCNVLPIRLLQANNNTSSKDQRSCKMKLLRPIINFEREQRAVTQNLSGARIGLPGPKLAAIIGPCLPKMVRVLWTFQRA